jgi:hypothetical protein
MAAFHAKERRDPAVRARIFHVSHAGCQLQIVGIPGDHSQCDVDLFELRAHCFQWRHGTRQVNRPELRTDVHAAGR